MLCANRVTDISYPATATSHFAYNGLGLRVQKTDSAGTANYLYDNAEPGSNLLLGGSTVYTPGISESTNGTISYYQADALGGVRYATDHNQNITASFPYDAFGSYNSFGINRVHPDGNLTLTFGGGDGYQTDYDSGLYLLGHRYYDPAIGRFISPDPARSGTNEYAYAGNNPLRWTDPTGLRPLTDQDRNALHKISWSSGTPGQMNAAVGAVTSAIHAVKPGQADPPNLKAVLWALGQVGNQTVYNLHRSYSNGLTTTIPADSYKCNIFVGDSYAIGAGVGYGGSGYPMNRTWWHTYSPVANDLASNKVIDNLVRINTKGASVGDIAALGRSSGLGHSMLYLGGGDMYVYAGEFGPKVDSLQYLYQHGFAGIDPTFRAFAP